MATSTELATSALSDCVTCSICLGTLVDPRVLPCSHTFCLPCIRQAVKDGKFTCSFQDKQIVSLSDIDRLPINRLAKDVIEYMTSLTTSPASHTRRLCDNCTHTAATKWCQNCAVYYCGPCAECVHKVKALQSHVITISIAKTNTYCPDHPDQQFRFWCTPCTTLVCGDCLLLTHADHPRIHAVKAAETFSSEIRGLLSRMGETNDALRELDREIQWSVEQQADNLSTQQQNIEQAFAALALRLEKRKRALIQELHQGHKDTKTVFDQRQAMVNEHLHTLTVRELYIGELLAVADPVQMLSFKATRLQNNKDLVEQCRASNKSVASQGCTFISDAKALSDLTAAVAQFGSIQKASGNTRVLGFSTPAADLLLTPTNLNWARGYTFALKRPLKLQAIRVQSNYQGVHVGFVVDASGTVVHRAMASSPDTTLKWLSIPLQGSVANEQSVFVWVERGNGSYAYKNRSTTMWRIDAECAVASKDIQSVTQISTGSTVTAQNNTYCIDMILDLAE